LTALTSETLPALSFPQSLRGLLDKKVGIVTGANHGIGAATAVAFAKAGAKVVVAARNQKALESLASSIESDGSDVLVVQTDVTDSTSVELLVNRTMERYGRLDFAFNNAGDGHMPSPLAEIRVEDFDRAISVNVRGTFLCMKYEIPAMLKAGGGAVVNMSSTAGMQGANGLAGYAAGKHAVIGLTRAAAMDYALEKIRVNAVAPGPIFTEHLADARYREQAALGVPMGRVGGREEVATVVAWLCSDMSSFVTGVVIPVDGGRLSGVRFARPGATSAKTPSAYNHTGQGSVATS
jgi:NAD(P)-dependent dehydrogenase (short-subunit alcohol dehydrogenase family)